MFHFSCFLCSGDKTQKSWHSNSSLLTRPCNSPSSNTGGSNKDLHRSFTLEELKPTLGESFCITNSLRSQQDPTAALRKGEMRIACFLHAVVLGSCVPGGGHEQSMDARRRGEEATGTTRARLWWNCQTTAADTSTP